MDTAELAEEISSRIGAFEGLGDDRPDHVLVRAVLLVGDDDVVYVDDNLSRSLDAPGLSGDVVIFTPGRVIRLTLSQPTDPGTSNENDSSVEATSWRRADLRSVAVLGADQAWGELPTEDMAETTGLRLTYADGQTIDLPARWEAGAGRVSREAVRALLPSLWEDLQAVS
jgi:hypothetical protein